MVAVPRRTAPRMRPVLRASSATQASASPLLLKFQRKRRNPWLLVVAPIVALAACWLWWFSAIAHLPQQPRQPQQPHNLNSTSALKKFAAGFPVTKQNAGLSQHYDAPRRPEKVLTVYMERPTTLDQSSKPLARRKTTAATLKKMEFPQIDADCKRNMQIHLPIDNFPEDDAFLPWIHDYVTADDGSEVRFVAQNKRRCETGEGKQVVMKYWEPQIALLQSVPVRKERLANGTFAYRLSSPEQATANETRYLCHFHSDTASETTLSKYSFNYEYVLWRKGRLPMYKETGPDVGKFETSQVLFSCPIPASLKDAMMATTARNTLYLDVVPIRTPARKLPLLTAQHVGQELADANLFQTAEQYGSDHYLPAIVDSGRWANLPVCPPPLLLPKQHFHFVGCTWTSASYLRRGDATVISDSGARLEEWIIFHKLVGMDQIYVYDNTVLADGEKESPLKAICDGFPGFCVYHAWPASVCSNNRPNFKNPGERSSQYAADASCRTKYGPSTEWMAFIDTDEYLVPMRNETWHELLKGMEEDRVDVLKLRSSRGRPRLDYMETTDDPTVCAKRSRRKSKFPEEPCALPRRNETFLRVYNCDYIRHPRPDRFSRAMKQIYRPASVLSHFVHYSTVTADIARYFKDTAGPYRSRVTDEDFHDRFLDELTEGVLVHAKSVLPHETMTRTSTCHNASKHTCAVGHTCPASVAFDDETHQKNLFHDENGKFCNCWVDEHVETHWVPLLEKALEQHNNRQQ